MLAIIIPYYKLTFFKATLQSLASQTDQRFKVYIGDDASPENPLILLENYKGKFDFVYHRFESNLGGMSLTQQWERCIALSEDEEWIMIFGDDDVLGENVVEQFYEKLEEIKSEKINVIRFSTQLIDKSGVVISKIYRHPKIEKSTDFIIKKIERQTRSSLSEYIYTKENVLQVGFKKFPLAWYSDDLAVLEFSNFKNVFSINTSIVSIRFSSSSISGDVTAASIKKKSKFKFYYYLLSQKKNHFSEDQTQILFSKISTCYLNNKKQFFCLLKISWLCLRFCWGLRYFEFIKSIAYNIVKKYGKRNV